MGKLIIMNTSERVKIIGEKKRWNTGLLAAEEVPLSVWMTPLGHDTCCCDDKVPWATAVQQATHSTAGLRNDLNLCGQWDAICVIAHPEGLCIRGSI